MFKTFALTLAVIALAGCGSKAPVTTPNADPARSLMARSTTGCQNSLCLKSSMISTALSGAVGGHLLQAMTSRSLVRA